MILQDLLERELPLCSMTKLIISAQKANWPRAEEPQKNYPLRSIKRFSKFMWHSHQIFAFLNGIPLSTDEAETTFDSISRGVPWQLFGLSASRRASETDDNTLFSRTLILYGEPSQPWETEGPRPTSLILVVSIDVSDPVSGTVTELFGENIAIASAFALRSLKEASHTPFFLTKEEKKVVFSISSKWYIFSFFEGKSSINVLCPFYGSFAINHHQELGQRK